MEENTMRLYDYSEAYVHLEQMLLSGEIDEETYNDTVESIQDGAEQKIESMSKMIDNFKAHADMLKAEEDKLNAKRKSLLGSVEWLTESLETHLKATGKESLQAGLYKIGYKKLPDIVEFTNPNAIPLAYKKKEVVTKISKRDIAKALKDGKTVRGAKLVKGRKKFEVKK